MSVVPTGSFTETTSGDVVNARHEACTNPRLAEVTSALVRHLHAFAKEVHLTQGECGLAVDFLTRTGQICSTERQEFILLSDVPGLSMLVDAINNRRSQGENENTVFGPFHVKDAPRRQMGDTICLDGKGETCLFEGQVLDLTGRPVFGATVDVWSDNADGFYDVQQPDVQPKGNNRGVFVTGLDGRYAFKRIKPVSYPIPDDGRVGQMLDLLGRHPDRPAHMHYLNTAPGFQCLVTHTFVGGDKYLPSDAVFGVKASLVAPFGRLAGQETLWRPPFTFVLTPG